jgi:IS30 family transposase
MLVRPMPRRLLLVLPLEKTRMRRVNVLSVESYKNTARQASTMVIEKQLGHCSVTYSREVRRDVAAR